MKIVGACGCEGVLVCAKAKSITDVFVDWLTMSGRPLSIVNFLVPDYKLPSRTHVTSLVKKRHRGSRKKLGSLVASSAHCGSHAFRCTDHEGTDRESTVNR